jgi:hypothetical protein
MVVKAAWLQIRQNIAKKSNFRKLLQSFKRGEKHLINNSYVTCDLND